MAQDEKLDQAPKAATTESSTGMIMLTLCAPSDDAVGYRHAVIPFPSSYEAACAEALKTFAAYVPEETEAVSLRQAVQRKNGQYVWSIIREDAWDIVLRKDCEEIGVFLPGISPETMPYQSTKPQYAQSRKRLVSFHFRDGPETSPPTLKVVYSFMDCISFADEAIKTRGWSNYEFRYDERMIGTVDERKAYRKQTKKCSVWSPLSNDAALFDFLLGVHPEPLQIQIFKPAPLSWVFEETPFFRSNRYIP